MADRSPHGDIMPGHLVQPLTDIGSAVPGGDGYGEMFGEIGVGPGIGLPVGIGEVVYLYAYVLLNEVDAGLQIRENALGVFL